MNLDTYMDDFGRDLTRAARTRRRRGTRRRLALALPVAAAATAVAIVLPGRGGTVDAIAAARAALAPNGEIVHMKVELLRPDGRRLFIPPVEQWYAGDPVRWRTVTKGGVLRDGRLRMEKDLETAYANDRLRFYDTKRDVVTIWRGDKLPADFGPSLLGGDPTSDLRAQLDKGDVRDDGVTTVDGREVRRLVRETKEKRFTQRFVYYMDPTTFAPIGGHLSIIRDGKTLPGLAFEVTGYERLPLNAETEKLLRFPKTGATKYVWRDER